MIEVLHCGSHAAESPGTVESARSATSPSLGAVGICGLHQDVHRRSGESVRCSTAGKRNRRVAMGRLLPSQQTGLTRNFTHAVPACPSRQGLEGGRSRSGRHARQRRDMLPRQPPALPPCRRPGRTGKTIMAGLLIKELLARGDLDCSI